jgi:uncharacterized protein (TIGR03437 family)
MVCALLLALLLIASPSFAQSSSKPKPAATKPGSSRTQKKAAAKQSKPAQPAQAKTAAATSTPATPARRERGQASPWFYTQRTYPTGTIPEDAVYRAMQQRAQLVPKGVKLFGEELPAAAQPGPIWAALGPGMVNGPEGLASGRVTAIAIDPHAPSTLYIGAAGGGVWKSTDAGLSWGSLGDDLMSLVSGALAYEARTETLYYGTGDYGARTYGAGIFRTTDGGATWLSANGWDGALNKPQFSGGTTARLVLHPNDSRTIYAARSSGLWRSTDGGDSWYRLVTGEASDFALAPGNPNRMYVALGLVTGAAQNGVYRSDDAGATWQVLSNLPSGTQVGRISLGLSPSNALVLYAALARSSDQQLLGVYRSNDGGNNWTKLPAPGTLFDSDGRGHGYWDNFVAVDPSNSETVFLGGVELWKSSDGGNTWSVLSLSGDRRVIHEDQFAIAFQPGAPFIFYVGNDGGIYRTADGGQTFTALNFELPVTQFNTIAVNPHDSTQVLGGTQDQGLVRYTGTRTWNQVARGDGGAVFFSAGADGTIYLAKPLLRPMRSTDDGASFVNIAGTISALDRVAFYPPFVAWDANPQTLYFGTQRVWQSRDGGYNWKALSADLTNGQYLTALAVSPLGRVYAGSADGRVSFSADGNVWIAGSGIPNRWVTAIATDPRGEGLAYLTVSSFGSGHVFKTQDGGLSWTDISGNLPDAPANAVVVDTNGVLYVAMDVGVFRSEDGALWASFNLGLPNAYFTALALDARSGKLVAASYGRGVYQVDLKPAQGPGPNLLARGVVNAFSSDTTLAPGGLATLYGTQLTGGDTASASGGLPTSLAGTSLTVNGKAAPLLYASPTLLNFQVPFEISGLEALIQVTTAQGAAAILVPLAPVAPGMWNAALHSDFTLVSDSNPASSGETLVFYATGLGATNPPVSTGVAAPLDPLAYVAAPVSCTFGGSTARVSYAGLAPWYVGLYQLNVQVPEGLSGPVAVKINVGGRSSNSVTVRIR